MSFFSKAKLSQQLHEFFDNPTNFHILLGIA